MCSVSVLTPPPLSSPKAWLGAQSSRKNSISHIDASLSRQPLVKGERLVRLEVNAVMLIIGVLSVDS